MKAKVIDEFLGVEDGKIYPRKFEIGEIISGDLARSEVESGRAEDLKKKLPPRNKSLTEAPKNKHSSVSQPAPVSQKKTVKKPRAKQKQSQSTTRTK